jgi:hypothetical protein
MHFVGAKEQMQFRYDIGKPLKEGVDGTEMNFDES